MWPDVWGLAGRGGGGLGMLDVCVHVRGQEGGVAGGGGCKGQMG